jgi:transposase
VAEVTIRQYVRERKRELGWSTRATRVPQSYEPGQEGQVDWYEAWAELNGEPVPLQVFTMRSMARGAAFHRAYDRATQQALLEAHEHAFQFFGGVFRVLRYDYVARHRMRSIFSSAARLGISEGEKTWARR